MKIPWLAPASRWLAKVSGTQPNTTAPEGTQLPPVEARAFYGPGNYIPSVAPPSNLPRILDYPFNTNINFAPRKYELISYDQMRELVGPSGNYLMRVILEKVKARLAMTKWEFRLRSQSGEHLAAVREKSAKDSRVKALYKMFERPDGEHDWPEWLGALLEDRFVIDAASLWVERDSRDRIVHWVPIDGATVNRIVNETGMTPMPPYAAYQQLVKGMPAVNFTAEDLLYMPANFRSNKLFGFSEVEQTIRLGQTQINRALWTLNHYTEGNIPELLLMFKSQDFTPEQIERFMATAESQLNGRLDQRQRMFPLPDATVHELRGKELFELFDEWMARMFCYQMGEPPTALVKMVNRASAKQMDDSREESGEKPFLNWIRVKLNRMIQNPLYLGWEDIEAAPLPPTEVDALKQAQIFQITVPLGIDTVDEARIALGKAPLSDEQMQQIQATKPQKPGEIPEETEDEDDEEDGTEKAAGSRKKKVSPLTPKNLAVPGQRYLY